ncbi:Peptidoglycan endopeptidase RipA precursor [Nocardia otitidiscaviarum]|uniref:Peptidoglycan endopeptidase RipA n=1 Tax=Nocardia otitidiscaviarum TaxID=1823 RepID=A0A379JMI9_9NOCA|nr:peptidoglycan DD-metalloendopeptidase family protein [Nocardia otitidiscaviarum]SUD49576.1 Peptidoglycan endopeptidase RipA precursor [Nocardia otitidiscaviarum]
MSTSSKAVAAALCGSVLAGAALMFSGGGYEPPHTRNCLPVPNDGIVAPSGSVIFPMREGTYQVSDVFGSRGGGHLGVDLAAAEGTPIYAVADGVVRDAGPASGFGQWIVLDSIVDGEKVSTVYGHMYPDGVLVRTGQRVRAGDHIADVGNGGESTGPHLHFEVVPGGRLDGGRQIDPMAWLAKAKTAPEPTGPDIRADGTTVTRDVRLAAAVSPNGGVGCGPTVGAGGLDVAKMVAEYPASEPFVPWILQGEQACPATPAPLIAAQLRNESGFRKGLVSPAGALGYAQFMPGTWEAVAVDGDGDGTRDPNSIADAVMSQAAYNCRALDEVKELLASGALTGDPIELMLSFYNCGGPGTKKFGQVCPYTETQNYVKEIPDTARRWTLPAATATPLYGDFGTRVVGAARRWLGTPYAWGGGNPDGPTHGSDGTLGFDCSGLTIYAVSAASGGRIVLEHYTTLQLNDPRGRAVPADQLMPGDLVFPAGSDPQHVAIYAGNGQVIEAPQHGDVVKFSPLPSGDIQARRFV